VDIGDWYQAFRLPRSRRLPSGLAGIIVVSAKTLPPRPSSAPRLEEVGIPVRDPVPPSDDPCRIRRIAAHGENRTRRFRACGWSDASIS